MDRATVVIALTLLVALLLPLALLARQKKLVKRNIVLLTGPPNGGKTSLYLRWTAHGSEKLPETVTSVGVSEQNLAFNAKFTLVDTPGSEKLRQFVRRYLQSGEVKLAVYVLDAAGGVNLIKEAARPLMTVLKWAEKYQFPVLIAVNKFDRFSTQSVAQIRQILQSEITQLRALQSKTVSSSEVTDDSWETEEFLGLDGKDFEFSDLETEVAIRDGSVLTNRLEKWEQQLESWTGY